MGTETKSGGAQATSNVVQTDETGNAAVGRRLAALRDGRSRHVFAQVLGISPTTLYRYERGVRSVEVELASKVCTLCGVTADWLLFGTGEAPRVLTSSGGER